VVAGLLRALPFPERLALSRELRGLAAPDLSPTARVEARRLHRAAAVRRRYALKPFW
jgi:hypothetical protein